MHNKRLRLLPIALALLFVVTFSFAPIWIWAQGGLTDELHLTSGSAFDPCADISGCVLHLDFSNTTTLYTGSDCITAPVQNNGDQIGCAQDKSGNGNNAIQATSSKKFTWTYPGLNGLGVGTADGTDDRLEINAVGAIFSGADKAASILAVIKKISNSGSDDLITFENSVDVHSLWLLGTSNSSYRFLKRDNAGSFKIGSGGASDTNVHIVSWVSPGITASIYQDGSSIVAAADVDVGTVTINRGRVGGRIEFNPFHGHVAELIIYDSALSTANRQLVEGYLAAKWGITLASAPRDRFLVQAHRLALASWLFPFPFFPTPAYAIPAQETLYQNRVIIAIPTNQIEAANAFADKWDPDVGGRYTFGSVQLSASGKGEATWTLCETAATDKMFQEIIDAQKSIGASQFKIYDMVKNNETLDTALEDMELKRIEMNEGAGAGK